MGRKARFMGRAANVVSSLMHAVLRDGSGMTDGSFGLDYGRLKR